MVKKTPTAALQFFKEHYPGRVYTRQQIRQALEDYRDAAGRGVRPNRFLDALSDSGVSEVEIQPENAGGAKAYRSFVRYVQPDATVFDVANSLKAGGYLSHGAAAVLHGLSESSDAIYWNKEQSAKPDVAGHLTQRGIDRAFSSFPRKSKYIFLFAGQRIVLLNGKNTRNYEVVEHASGVPVTALERTLFDIAVRPAYAGGPEAVRDAYRVAVPRINLAKLLRIIRHVGHVYPYHQAIGFYLSAAGFEASRLTSFRALGSKFRFYLGNKMQNPAFDEQWKVYIPRTWAREKGRSPRYP
jgi:hypothetical protein